MGERSNFTGRGSPTGRHAIVMAGPRVGPIMTVRRGRRVNSFGAWYAARTQHRTRSLHTRRFLPLRVTHRSPPVVMVGEGRPSTSFLAAISKDVDGGPSPTMTGEASRRVNHFGAWYKTALDVGIRHLD
jgi:hypothetical protein